MRIGEIAKQERVSAEVLRNWEEAGKIPKVGRTPLGQRDYGPQDIFEIQRVIRERIQKK